MTTLRNSSPRCRQLISLTAALLLLTAVLFWRVHHIATSPPTIAAFRATIPPTHEAWQQLHSGRVQVLFEFEARDAEAMRAWRDWTKKSRQPVELTIRAAQK